MSLTSSARSALFLAFALTAAATAACSGGDAAVPGPAPAATSPTEPAPGPEPEPTPSATPAVRPGVDPAVLEALQEGAVDVAKLPDDLSAAISSRAKLQAVMKSFTVALGTGCDGCHAKVGTKLDYGAETPNKNITRNMWTQFVRGLEQADGSALYCDSCHQGKMKFLDFKADEAMTWMAENFVGKLARRDGEKHGCKTCHGEPFDEGFLASWAK